MRPLQSIALVLVLCAGSVCASEEGWQKRALARHQEIIKLRQQLKESRDEARFFMVLNFVSCCLLFYWHAKARAHEDAGPGFRPGAKSP